MQDKYTSLKLSKWLQEKGFEGEVKMVYIDTRKSWKECNCIKTDGKFEFVPFDGMDKTDPECELVENKAPFPFEGYNLSKPLPAYDILNDLCVTYAKEVFGEEITKSECYSLDGTWIFTDDIEAHTVSILRLLREDKKEEAEQYIMDNSILGK